MGRVFAAILLVVVLVIGGGIIANTAYQAGLSTAVTTTAGGATVVAPVVVPAAGWGIGWGFNPIGWFFGFLFFMFFLFIVFGLIRAIVWGGRHRRGGWGYGHGDWGAKGGWSDDGGSGHGRSPWEARAHETFDDWHRRAHGDSPDAGPTDSPTSPTGVA